jgi:prolipoprotein diacylglyceryltransferase
MQQILFRLPILQNWFPDGVPIYGFGMMLFLAFLVCTWLAGRRGERAGISKETIQDLAIWLFVGGLLGARVAYLLQDEQGPRTVGEFLAKLPYIWEGGIVLYGSVLGALASYALGYFLVFRRRGVSTLKLADVVAPSVAVGICLGRIGCFLNGCCYGQVACADCPVYGVHFPLSAPARFAMVDAGYQTAAGFTLSDRAAPEGARVGQVDPSSEAYAAGLRPGDVIVEANGNPINGPDALSAYLGNFRDWRGKSDLGLKVLPPEETREVACTPRTLGLHPTQLYESISMFLLFLLLTAYFPFRTRDGQVMGLLMICYAVHRYVNELLRNDPRPKGFECYGSVFLLGAGIALMVYLYRKPAQYRTEWAIPEQNAGSSRPPLTTAASAAAANS